MTHYVVALQGWCRSEEVKQAASPMACFTVHECPVVIRNPHTSLAIAPTILDLDKALFARSTSSPVWLSHSKSL